ncbi:MAG TPA: histidine kinase, partial [Longimicrobiaceae bacterium]|nr:histidine kinase [Longimicrobiaceae bacterium]
WVVFMVCSGLLDYLEAPAGPGGVAAAIARAAPVLVWAPFGLLFFWISRRFPFPGRNWMKGMNVSCLMIICVVLVYCAVEYQYGRWLEGPAAPSFRGVVVAEFAPWAVICSNLIGTAHAIQYFGRTRMRELAAARLETQLVVAELQTLELQLQPHFLFNALNSVSALMIHDVAAADRVLRRIIDLLRLAVEGSRTQLVPLRQELAFLRLYLEIQQVRYGEDRLRVVERIDPPTLPVNIPHMILQPLVENSIRHGIAPLGSRQGRLEISAAVEGARLRVEVRDDGVGLPEAWSEEEMAGIGIANTRARLEQLYGAGYRFSVEPAPGGGTAVHLVIPTETRIVEP